MNEFISAGDIRMPYLYHYQPFNPAYVRSVIQDRQLYFSRPSTFNDPWDCKPHFSIDLSDPESVAANVQYFQRIDRERNSHLSEAELAARARIISEDRPFLESLVHSMYQIHEAIDRRYRIYCLAGSSHVPLMWSHYAASHTGVCFKFAVAGPFQAAMKVQYRDRYPALSLGATYDGVRALLAKSSDWAYEDEYRLVAEERSESSGPGLLTTDSNIFDFPRQCLVGVFMGCQMPAESQREIVAMVRQTAPSVELRHMKLVRDRYALVDVDVPI